MTADLELLTLQYNLFEMLQVPLCSDYLTADADNQNQCPGSGSYDFSITYKLPSAGQESTSWLASGWAGSGIVRIYAEQDTSMLIGQCTFTMKTYVTPSASSSLPYTPTAAETVGIVLGALAVVALACLWCYCCRRKRAQKTTMSDTKTITDVKSTVTPEDVASFFKRMDDEQKSMMSGNPKSVTSKNNSKSVVSELP
jgi:hypothetical protein